MLSNVWGMGPVKQRAKEAGTEAGSARRVAKATADPRYGKAGRARACPTMYRGFDSAYDPAKGVPTFPYRDDDGRMRTPIARWRCSTKAAQNPRT